MCMCLYVIYVYKVLLTEKNFIVIYALILRYIMNRKGLSIDAFLLKGNWHQVSELMTTNN